MGEIRNIVYAKWIKVWRYFSQKEMDANSIKVNSEMSGLGLSKCFSDKGFSQLSIGPSIPSHSVLQ